eukprot:CAMPEP_0113935656 /NCGR_PEP_ID=MMETSP1339-20121228/2772_1 /TAXON_ID=94617 /ORGANISM="Fibrocapsa japonica" /LENGTH=71 /DNA_ID=CAMNT_0000937885 /DNA_START=113 /DNA_END=325 /DNA_ORIENTATION=- /assembly_acc=CAM_ASM_000762
MVQVPYSSPINPALYGTLALFLYAGGIILMALFFIYEMKVSKEGRKMAKELALAVPSSLLLGFGSLFLFLW